MSRTGISSALVLKWAILSLSTIVEGHRRELYYLVLTYDRKQGRLVAVLRVPELYGCLFERYAKTSFRFTRSFSTKDCAWGHIAVASPAGRDYLAR